MSSARLGRRCSSQGSWSIAASASGAGQVFVGPPRGRPVGPALRSQSSAIPALCVPIAAWLPFCEPASEQLLLEVIAYTRARADIAQR
jgi:hypothetical protein